MAKMFDKVSEGFLNAIKDVLEAKKTNKHGHDRVGEEDADIDNDGDTDTSDKYLHNRRKAIGKAMMKKEEAEQVDEKLSDEAKAAIRFAAGGGAKVKPLVKIAKMAKKPMGEEADQIDELSKPTMGRYINKAKDSIDMASYRQGHKEAHGSSSKPLEKKLTKRHKGIETAVDKLTKEEIEMIEAKMAGVADGSMEGEKHMCATKVFHKEWNEGTPIKTMHADPDADGLIEWYDVMFDHGIERVMTEDMEILQAESHMHSKKKMKEEVEELDELSKNTMLRYVSANKKERKAAEDKGDYGKSVQRMRGTDMAVRKYTAKPGSKYVRVPATEEVELDEARGRPKKAAAKDFTVHPITKEKLMHDNPAHMKKIELLQKNKVLEKPKVEAAQHVINQLQKAKTSMQGGATIHFTHGESKHVSGSHAAKLITKYQGMRPSEKEDFQKKISHSHAELMKHV